ncbi:peptidylprolyl isomerase [Sulfitobacter sp. S0837]|uniref:peptidylprolyl isomerase n=1 Tax=Sulfitobacter maritimus TaxID=2741719 RepID=UPI001582E1BC|nr:peptidylprolyl isomerase [Sulfitobacter maritimus]NUH64390.1 peptidylprolyl isomerase [Sulfitobacter maritimus]
MWEVTKQKFRVVMRGAAGVALALMISQPATAQNLFAPVVQIDGAVITEYEVQQRQRFMQLLGAPGTDRESVIDALIEDRLRGAILEQAGLEVTPEGIRAGMAEFAARADLTTDEFLKALAQAQVSEETFRDFILISSAWRDLIRARYNNRVTITDAEVDRALGSSRGSTSLRVLLSEIIIPAPPQNADQVNALAEKISKTRSEAEFSAYARQYSATASRGRGGQMPWTELDKLPPSLHPILLGLAPGEVTKPLPIPNAVALFQLRGIEETDAPSVTYSEIDYAAYYIPGGRSEAALARAAQLRGQVDQCDDLYGVAKGQPANVLDREVKAPSEIPQDVAIELAKLDPGEVSTTLTRANGQTLMFLMLCKRVTAANADVDREAVISSIRQRKLQGFAQQLVDQARADARIIRQ